MTYTLDAGLKKHNTTQPYSTLFIGYYDYYCDIL